MGTSEFKFDFNQLVEDKVTGFKGIILGRTEYATGCVQYGVCPNNLTAEGKVPEWHWLDGNRIQTLNEKIDIEKESGGPCPSAPSMD